MCVGLVRGWFGSCRRLKQVHSGFKPHQLRTEGRTRAGVWRDKRRQGSDATFFFFFRGIKWAWTINEQFRRADWHYKWNKINFVCQKCKFYPADLSLLKKELIKYPACKHLKDYPALERSMKNFIYVGIGLQSYYIYTFSNISAVTWLYHMENVLVTGAFPKIPKPIKFNIVSSLLPCTQKQQSQAGSHAVTTKRLEQREWTSWEEEETWQERGK